MRTDLEAKLEAVVVELNSEKQGPARDHIQSLLNPRIHSFDALIAAVQDQGLSKEVRMIGCWALGQLRDRRAVKGLLAVFQDQNTSLIWEAAKSLGIIGSQRSIRPLIAMLREGQSVDQRASAAYALGFVGDKQAIEPLMAALLNRKEETKVRAYAAEALAHLGDERSVGPLIDCLSDESPEVRFWCVYALGQIGNRSALPELERLAKIDNQEVPGWGTVSSESASAIEAITTRVGRE